ncbi:MAG: DUF305 domain-containing protein [Pseudomonadota bacterium]
MNTSNTTNTTNARNTSPGSLSGLACALILAMSAAAMPLPAAAQAHSDMASHKAMASSSPDGPAMKMHKSMNDMHEKMGQMKMSGDVDHDFVMMMRAHHQGALDMAQAEVDAGKNPAVVAMAKKIITAQRTEIAQFDDWLKVNPMK